MREKLIDVFCAVLGADIDCRNEEAIQFVDELIANGVTVQSEIDAKTFRLMRECERLKEEKENLANVVNVLEEINSDLYKKIRGVTLQEWISVKDRLPDKNGEYLCRHTDKSVHSAEYESIYGSFGYWFDFWEDEYKEWVAYEGVTHWMPLPEPPKGE